MSYHFAVLSAVLLMRLWELHASWRRLLADRRSGRARLLPERMYPLVVLVQVIWPGAAALEVLLRQPLYHPWLALPLLGAWLAVLGLRFRAVTALGPWWNWWLQERTDQAVVNGGPYRFIRHPEYMAAIMEAAVVPLLVGAYITALPASLATGLVLWGRIMAEESYLFRFAPYRNAFKNKKRFIPGVL